MRSHLGKSGSVPGPFFILLTRDRDSPIMMKSMTEKKTPAKVRGYIQVYTGNGKGKTTAALGLALRAAGHGLRTYIGQFLKGQEYGELLAIQRLSEWITLEQFGRRGFIHVSRDPDKHDIERAHKGLKKCLQAMLSGKFQVIVLDEVNVAVDLGLIPENDILAFLGKKPDDIEIVLTGRFASDSIIKKADLVTEMKELKHYYSSGVKAREGIEK
jgi:cob(I)alamin adenosyltransferase